jgi:diaminopimelate epimerase
VKKTLWVPFHKLQALGNDFIVSSGAVRPFGDRLESGGLPIVLKTAALKGLATAICERHMGVGADGFLLVQRDRETDCDAAVRFFNADGSEAEMSGNGIRCVGAVLMDSGDYETPLRLRTLAGVKVLETVTHQGARWEFRVRMGHPILAPQAVPFAVTGVSAPLVGYTLATRHGKQRVTVTSMGNPHCSLFIEDFEQIDWPAIGREIEVHPLFPNRTNVEFVRVVSRRRIEVRFWERGVGITASSGTGSCAAAVASILNGFTNRKLRVETIAGKLRVGWPDGGEVTLTGPVVKVAEGDYYYVRTS